MHKGEPRLDYHSIELSADPFVHSGVKGASFLGDFHEFYLAVGKSYVEFFGALHDVLSLAGRNILSNFSAVGSVVHKEEFNVFGTSNQKLSEATWEHMSGL